MVGKLRHGSAVDDGKKKKNIFFHPVKRQIFGDASGKTSAPILIVRHNNDCPEFRFSNVKCQNCSSCIELYWVVTSCIALYWVVFNTDIRIWVDPAYLAKGTFDSDWLSIVQGRLLCTMYVDVPAWFPGLNKVYWNIVDCLRKWTKPIKRNWNLWLPVTPDNSTQFADCMSKSGLICNYGNHNCIPK